MNGATVSFVRFSLCEHEKDLFNLCLILFPYLFVWLDFGKLDLWPHVETVVANVPKLSQARVSVNNVSGYRYITMAYTQEDKRWSEEIRQELPREREYWLIVYKKQDASDILINRSTDPFPGWPIDSGRPFSIDAASPGRYPTRT